VISSRSPFPGHNEPALDGLLGDTLIDLYVDWREECVGVQAAYETWRDAMKDERAVAFAAYRAALDREERASEAYAELVVHVAGDAPQPR
jgi:hypothetical protein